MRFNYVKKSIVLICWASLCLCASLLTGCAWLIEPPETDPVALKLVKGLQLHNGHLEQYKMLSKVQIELEEVVQSVATMAIAAHWPDRMRVEVLSPAGQPMTSMAADGQTIQIRSQGKAHIYRLRQSATSLAQLIHIPLGVAQLQGILIGRPDLPDFAGLELGPQTQHETTVVLKSRWNQTLAVLRFDTNEGAIRHLEMFDEEGQSLYRAIWLQWKKRGKYHMPSKLFVENDGGHRVTLGVRRFWPDVDLPATTFELSSRQ